jgi:NAD(P)-dependent dehydrogenase (short-subunit alcohol dehydrogenase family)
MDLQLSAKRAIVTGGSQGIGKAVARRLVEEGASVAIAARHPEPLQDAARELAAAGGTVVAIPADTTDDPSVDALVAGAVDALGGLDIVVNCAAKASGQATPTKLVDLGAAELLEAVDTKVMGYARLIRAAVPHLIAAGGGRIVNVDGLGSRMTGNVVTSVRNAGVVALTKNAADELGHHGINVTAVSPGLVRTEASPGVLEWMAGQRGSTVEQVEEAIGAGYDIGRMVTADEVAVVVTWLASPLSTAISGDTIPCGGGVRGHIYY